MDRFGLGFLTGLAAAAFCATPMMADEMAAGGTIAIELNAVSDDTSGCTLTFVIENNHPVGIDQLIFETVLFDASGGVKQLTLFDFGALPAGRPRVRQFAVPETTCGSLGRILFNGTHTCSSDGLSAEACATELRATTRTEIEVLS
ncbi:hypothetical protein [uncultured Roseobacter sp.]|uniref:hypothetical protein n=1 Tax=uncultured Roseobacter sp. TaxID=114847 RepID=UPI00261AE1C5|nr:hypothetical protein [uncultured Roseobacter sp.]